MVGMLNAALYCMLLLHCVLIDHYKLSGHKKILKIKVKQCVLHRLKSIDLQHSAEK